MSQRPERESEDAWRRMEIVATLETELARSGLAGLAKQKGYRRYIKVCDGAKAEVNWEKVKRDARYDGNSPYGATPSFLLLR